MFNDRDLIIMGGGAALAVFALFLPLPFLVKATLGGILLLASLVLALMRLGPDRVPIETWLARRRRYRKKAHRYTYHDPSAAASAASVPEPAPPPRDAPAASPEPPASSAPLVSPLHPMPIGMAWQEVGVYRIVRVWLAVIGAYVVYWMATGGAEQLGIELQLLLK